MGRIILYSRLVWCFQVMLYLKTNLGITNALGIIYSEFNSDVLVPKNQQLVGQLILLYNVRDRYFLVRECLTSQPLCLAPQYM